MKKLILHLLRKTFQQIVYFIHSPNGYQGSIKYSKKQNKFYLNGKFKENVIHDTISFETFYNYFKEENFDKFIKILNKSSIILYNKDSIFQFVITNNISNENKKFEFVIFQQEDIG